jgi:hypothetical protein
MSQMKNLLILIILFATYPAWADWVLLAENDGRPLYFEPSNVIKSGYMRRVWIIKDKSDDSAENNQSLRSRFEIDCNLRRYRVLSATIYSEPMGRGKKIEAVGESVQWDPIRSNGSPMDVLLHKVCVK